MHVVSATGISHTVIITNNIDRNSSTTDARRLEKTFSVFAPIHPAAPIHLVLRCFIRTILLNTKLRFAQYLRTMVALA